MTREAPCFDPRVTAARADLAAESLRGQVEAPRFVPGVAYTVRAETLDVKRHPRPDAPLETQMLYGETLTVFDEEDGWGWAQADRDGYVGYVAMSALARGSVAATHRVIVNRTFVYPAADMKQPPCLALPLDSRLAVEGRRGDFLTIGGHGFVFAAHVASLDHAAFDAVDVARRMIGAPYLWGGKSVAGVDCSGLVQLAFSLAGRAMPRDTDMQEKLGDPLRFGDDLAGVARGDLVFWRGHVGLMVDASTLLHANAHHMLVVSEPLDGARDRVRAAGSEITSIRRL